MGIESGKVFHNGVKVEHAEFFPCRAKLKKQPCALGRIEMYFCLMQEEEILLMGLSVNQHKCDLLW